MPDSLTPILPLWFLGNDRLVTTFLTRERVETLACRDATEPVRPLRLHAVFFDAASGHVSATREWPTPSSSAGILAATSQGNFVVRAGDRIMAYSPTLDPGPELRLRWETQAGGKYREYWSHYTSPSGRSIVLDRHLPSGQKEYRWIESTYLQELHFSTDLLDMPHFIWVPSISDTAAASMRESREILLEVWVRGVTTPWRRICGPPSDCATPVFVNNDMLLLVDLHRLTLVATDGRVLFTQGFPYEDWLHTFHWDLAVASDGGRFAVVVTTPKGGSTLLDIGPRYEPVRLMVFDIPSLSWVYTLDTKRLKIKKISALALSSDGSLLAILRDSIVEVYKVAVSAPQSPRE